MKFAPKIILVLCLCTPIAGQAQETERFKVFGASAEREAYFTEQREIQAAKDAEVRAQALRLAQARAEAARKAQSQLPQIGSGY